MEHLQEKIERKLIANVLIDKCKHSNAVVFDESWCTQDRCIRFTTDYFRKLFPVKHCPNGKWDSNDFIMFEINNLPGRLNIGCVLDLNALPKSYQKNADLLRKICSDIGNLEESAEILKQWNLTDNVDNNELLIQFDNFLTCELPTFENVICEGLKSADSLEELSEGCVRRIVSTAYERNPIARKKCLEAHGTACAICGMQFDQIYGPQFGGIIEVHHVMPLSEIHKGHVVDPIHDLIPVCPNCHMALHSKKDGVYSPDELRSFVAAMRD